MPNFTAQDVKALREATSAGMLDCKKALTETDGDFDAAVDFLRAQGIAKAGKKADREAKEGLIKAVSTGKTGALVQVSCETDFVAKNDTFAAYVEELLGKVDASGANDVITESFAAEQEEELKAKIATIGENMKIPAAVRFESEGTVASYLHAGGRVGVLVDVDGEYDEEIVKNLCLHIAAFSPLYLSPEDVPADAEERERAVATEKAAGKPANIVEKIVEGNIRKWKEEICLVKQGWIMDDKVAIETKFPKLKINRFVRYQIGG